MSNRYTLTYSIAIRTLGTAGDKFRQELDSICFQTNQPERVVVYIAEGYERPDYTVGKEEYVWIPKGMVAQRALHYHEIKSDCILLLDDDVWLAPNSAEKMLRAMEIHHADCIGADVFQNHSMPLMTKIYAAITNLVLPHFGQKWAFKIHRNGSFSYLNNPKQSFYWSQKSDGPACLWKKSTFLKLRMKDECWLDNLGFAYNDDSLESYKLYRNGGRLGILFDSGIKNLDGQTASASFRNSPEHIYIRTKASLMIWWRMCYRNGNDTLWSRFLAVMSFGFKTLWLIPVVGIASIVKRNGHLFLSYFKGLRDGWQEIHSPAFRNLPPYIAERLACPN